MQELLQKITDLVNGGLGIDPAMILIQLVGVLFLFIVIKVKLWGPITKNIEDRKTYIANQVKEAEMLKENAVTLEASYQEKILEAKTISRNIIEKASNEASLEAENIINKAKDSAFNETVKARELIEKEKEIAKKELKDETLDIAFQIASKLVEKEVEKANHTEVVNEFLNGVDKFAS